MCLSGGVSHGPRGPISYYYMLPMKVRVQGLKVALSSKMAQVTGTHSHTKSRLCFDGSILQHVFNASVFNCPVMENSTVSLKKLFMDLGLTFLSVRDGGMSSTDVLVVSDMLSFFQDYLHIVDSLNIPTPDSQYLLELIRLRHWGESVLIVDV